MTKQQVCILGSTGSIGTQALDVIQQHSDRYQVYALTANNSVELLAKQARAFQPAAVVIANEAHYEQLRSLLADMPDIKVYAGQQAIDEIVQADPIDSVIAAMVGFAGLSPTIHAIKAHKKILLANKETLVVAGALICQLAGEYNVPILPIDSEHSAIFQSIVGELPGSIEKILLTCSGGPFRKLTLEQLEKVTAGDALKHPTWDMGAKITIDSATLMNKGFEVIEAKWLFNQPPQKIQVLIHPQSIIHSAVQFCDGSVKAQLGLPDIGCPSNMRSPSLNVCRSTCPDSTSSKTNLLNSSSLMLRNSHVSVSPSKHWRREETCRASSMLPTRWSTKRSEWANALSRKFHKSSARRCNAPHSTPHQRLTPISIPTNKRGASPLRS